MPMDTQRLASPIHCSRHIPWLFHNRVCKVHAIILSLCEWMICFHLTIIQMIKGQQTYTIHSFGMPLNKHALYLVTYCGGNIVWAEMFTCAQGVFHGYSPWVHIGVSVSEVHAGNGTHATKGGGCYH